MDIFESASRKKLRFASSRGELTTEQLWDLPLLVSGTQRGTGLDLDTVTRAVSSALKDVTEESFVAVQVNPRKAELELKLEVLKHIIKVKLEEQAMRKAATERAAKRAKLLEALAAKEDAELGAKSKEDILKELAELDA